MLKKYGTVAILLVLSSSIAAMADQIDEQQKAFLSQVAVAKNTRQITSKQAAELDKQLKEFSKLKRQLKERHADVLTAEDKLLLNQTLNVSRQKLDAMTNNKVPK
jgi:hypothetical protein